MPRIMIEIYINGKKHRLWGQFGWYPGEEFKLLDVTLFDITEYLVIIFQIQIAKLLIGFGIQSYDN